MKLITVLLVFFFSLCGFSQTNYDEFKGKYEEFDSYSKPDKNGDLSKFLRRRIDMSLLDAVTFRNEDESRKRIFLSFVFNKGGDMKTYVTSKYSELNNSIKNAFKDYDVSKLGIPDKNRLNRYMVQVISVENGKAVINCSTKSIQDRYPILKGCEKILGNNAMKKCINKQLEKLIIKNMSVDEIKKQMIIGKLTLYPNFLIDSEGNIKDIMAKSPASSMTDELSRILALLPKPLAPPTRNGNPTHYYFNGKVELQIDSNDDQYKKEVINKKDTLSSSNNALALHFKKHISEKDLNSIVYAKRRNAITIAFSIDKKGKVINAKTPLIDKSFNAKLVSVFKKFPVEELHIKSDDILMGYAFDVIKKVNGKNIILCSNKVSTSKYPMYKGCERSKNPDELKTCISSILAKDISRKFNTTLRSKTKLTGDIRMYCIFKIDTNGEIVDVKVRAPNPFLANEAEEIIKGLPKAKSPGYINGKPVKYPFSLPLVFRVGENKPEDPFKDLDKKRNF